MYFYASSWAADAILKMQGTHRTKRLEQITDK